MKRLRRSLLAGLTLAPSALANAQAPQTESNAADTEWLGYNGGYDATRFSPLTQINTRNVAKLKEVARFKISETLSFQCNPVVVDGTMFVTTVKSTYAIGMVFVDNSGSDMGGTGHIRALSSLSPINSETDL